MTLNYLVASGLCNGLEPQTTFHYLLCCNLFSILRVELLNYIHSHVPSLTNYSSNNLLNFPFYESAEFNVSVNKEILNSSIKCLKASKCLDAMRHL